MEVFKTMRGISVRILLFTSCSSAVMFLREPDNVTRTYEQGSAMEGNFFVDCEVNSLLSYQKVSWFKQGEIISDNYTFRSNVNHLVDGDRYILVAPKQSRPLRFQMAVLSVSFSTAAFDSGSHQCAVTWLNDTVLLNGRSRTAVVNINGAYVPPVQPICKISNISDDEITITSPTVVRGGDQLFLTCFTDSLSSTNAMLFWSRSNENGLLSVTRSVSSDGVVSIKYFWIPSWDDGPTLTFTCTLQYPGLSSVRTCSVNFNIQYAPRVTIDPTDVMVTEENNEIVLQCNQDANPQVTEPVWYYDDDVVNSGGRFILEGMSVRIMSFGSQDNGVHLISCELTNDIGTGRANATVSVILPTQKSYSGFHLTQNSTYEGSTQLNGVLDLPKQGQNIGLIAGGTSSAVLLIVIILILVTAICLKSRRKTPSPSVPKDEHLTEGSVEPDPAVGYIDLRKSTHKYASVNEAFNVDSKSSAVDVAVELRVTFKNREKQESMLGEDKNPENSVEVFYSKPLKNKGKPVSGPDRMSSAVDETEINKETKPASPVAANESFNVVNTMINIPPPPENIEANQGEYQNVVLKPGKKRPMHAREVEADERFQNITATKGQRGDSVYDDVYEPESNTPESTGKNSTDRVTGVIATERRSQLKNAEGLTYADLDLSNVASTNMSQQKPTSDDNNTVYAELQM